MYINGPTHLHGAQPVNPPHASRLTRPDASASSSPIQDELDLSEAGRVMERIGQLPEVRQERVDQIRAQIASGTYETDAKLEVAAGRLLNEIG